MIPCARATVSQKILVGFYGLYLLECFSQFLDDFINMRTLANKGWRHDPGITRELHMHAVPEQFFLNLRTASTKRIQRGHIDASNQAIAAYVSNDFEVLKAIDGIEKISERSAAR